MKNIIDNTQGSERSVEIPFTCESILSHCKKEDHVLEVGGVPTTDTHYRPIKEALKKVACSYDICDFRGGKYRGDFVTLDFGDLKFDVIMFISSLEHFPQCTEGDMQFREGEDRRGFQKALSVLKPGGKIILTVPFGKPVWQNYHQNYNMEKLEELTEGSTIITSLVYKLYDDENQWKLEDPANMEDVLYTTKAFGVGCFVLQKD